MVEKSQKKTNNTEQLNKESEDLSCKTCLKEPELCLCSIVKKLPSHLHVLILQHPQEPDKTLGSARLAYTALENSTLKVGLSWANLSKALGRQSENGKWGVLYLGGRQEKKPGEFPPRIQVSSKENKKQFVRYEPGDFHGLEGIVVLDGTWSQAKTMWWRNPWLLKLRRIILNPSKRSLYGELRKEPRRECLSTIESIAETFDALGDHPETATQLRGYFGELLKRVKGV